MIVAAAIAAFAEKTRRVFADNRKLTLGASEIGTCLRRSFYTKHSEPGVPKSYGAGLRGQVFEDHVWTPAMRAAFPRHLHYAGHRQRTFRSGYLSATPDGILDGLPRDALAYLRVPDIGPSGCIVVDSKTVDPRINLSEPKPAHVFQIQVQLGLVREQTRFQPAYGLLSYVNASFFDDVVEFAIKFDSRIFAQAYVRATAIMNAKTAGDLPPEAWIYAPDECERCPYAAPCQALRGDVPTAKEEALNPELFDKVIALGRETKRLQEIAKSALAEQRESEHRLKELLRTNNRRIADDGIVRVVWSAIKGRPS